MGLYNFKKQFVPFILSGRKTHTIRAPRKHPERVGNTMHLYTGLRQKGAKLLLRSRCMKIEQILIMRSNLDRPPDLDALERFEIVIDGVSLDRDEKEALARRDGFRDFKEMMAFWDGRLPFEGHIIHWRPPQREKVESVREIRDLLGLASCTIPLSEIRTWTDAQREAATKWAAKSYLRASDNPVRVPPRPAFLNRFMNRSAT